MVHPLLQPAGTPGATSFYDTSALKSTLERLVDFDRINSGEMRFSVGAVNVATGNFVYFDNSTHVIRPEHMMASGALPPGFPAIEIEGEHYWDGGLVSNTPLQWVLECAERQDTLAFQVDVWNSRGAVPRTLGEVMTRQKEIQYSSRTRANSDRFKKEQKLRNALADLIAKLPDELESTPEFALLNPEAGRKVYNVIQLIYRSKDHEGGSKDYEFSRRSMEDHWTAGSTTRSAPCAIRKCWSGPTAPTASSPSISPRTHGFDADHVPSRKTMKATEVRDRAFAMPLTQPAYPPGPYRFYDREFLIITYRTDREKLRELVPEPLELVSDLVKFEFIRMPDSTGFGDYTEAGQVIPVRFGARTGNYTLYMFLNDHPPIAAGRELWGFPKKLAGPTLRAETDTLVGTLDYGPVRVATGTMGYKHKEADAAATLRELCRSQFPAQDHSARRRQPAHLRAGRVSSRRYRAERRVERPRRPVAERPRARAGRGACRCLKWCRPPT